MLGLITKGGTVQFISNSGTKGRQVVNLTPRPLYPRESTPVLMGGWVDTRSGLIVLENEKSLAPISNPGFFSL
jgi:hypothetical protein